MTPRHKKRAAWGSICSVSPGVWRIRYWSKGVDGSYRRRSCTVRGTRVDAERRRSELMLLHSEDAPCPTVGDVWRTLALPEMERRVESGSLSANSLKQYGYAWAKHVEPVWGDVECDAVRPLAVQQWLYGLTSSAAKQAVPLLRAILDHAVRLEHVGHNVMRERYVMPSSKTVERMDDGTWTLEELGEVWRSCAWGRWWEAAFLLCGFGGMRVAEALGVMGADVSESHGCAVVRVCRQVTSKSGEVTEDLKTPQSRRAVAIPGRAGQRLLAMAAEEPGYLSGDGHGCPRTRFVLKKAWDRAKLPEGMRHPFRNLRNSWQTNMRWVLRVPTWAIESMMGHRLAGVTGRHYDRPQAEMFAEIVAESYAEHPFDEGWSWADGTIWDQESA